VEGKAPTSLSSKSDYKITRKKVSYNVLEHKEQQWRKLTVVECCRLQTFPDKFTAFGINENGEKIEISKTQQYRALGNSWTAEVIAYFFRRLHDWEI